MKSAIEKSLDENIVVKGRVDNSGLFDVSVTGAISPTLSATFTTGGST